MKIRSLLFLCCFPFFLQKGLAQMREDLKVEIDKIIFHDTEITYKKIPGFVIGIIYRDSVFVFSYGSVTKDSLKPPDRETIFEIGGLTKVFTASLVSLLVEEGILNYDSTLNHYLPAEYQNKNAGDITINDLVVHTSGMPKLPLEFGLKSKDSNNPYASYTKIDLLDFYKNYSPDPALSGKYYYSNLNYALLELAIEFATNQPFESVLKKKIFAPLNMQNSCITLSDSQAVQVSAGYTIGGFETPVWQFQSFAASEGMKSSADDLLKFLSCNLNQTNPALAANFAQTHVQVIETELNKNVFMTKGWHLVKTKKYYDSIMHAGATSGQRAFMAFVKETQTGVVLLSNSEYSTDGLGYLILRLINNNWKKSKR